MSWIATARRTDSLLGVVMASSKALVCRLLQARGALIAVQGSSEAVNMAG
jgi:hypothetical protein